MTDLDAVDKILIYYLSGDLGDSPAPYADLAVKTGLTEEEVLKRIRGYQENKTIRRFGATLWHQRSGFSANAMMVFEVERENSEEAGRSLAARPYVSHCYLRRTAPGWPFNLYAMVHAENRDQLLNIIDDMAGSIKAKQWRMLESLKELKKASRRYFLDK